MGARPRMVPDEGERSMKWTDWRGGASAAMAGYQLASGGEAMFARFAPLLFVLLWSSSFIAAKAGLRHLSPLLFVAVRLGGCAVVLLVAMLLLRRSWRPLAGGRWLHCAVAGAL